MIGKRHILKIKINDNWIFLILVAFTIVFPLELESRLHYLSIIIRTDTSPAEIDSSRTRYVTHPLRLRSSHFHQNEYVEYQNYTLPRVYRVAFSAISLNGYVWVPFSIYRWQQW